MITQVLLNMASELLLLFVTQIPDMPSEWLGAIGWVQSAGSSLGSLLAKLGIVIPWYVVFSVVQAWAGAVVFWGAVQLVRFVLWAVGR